MSMLSVFLSHYPLYFLRQGLFLNLQLTNSAKVTGQPVSGLLPHLPLSTGVAGVLQQAYFYMDTGIKPRPSCSHSKCSTS